MSDDEEFRRMLAAVSAEFRAELPARLAAIDTLWAAVIAGGPAAQPMDELIRAVHKIAGSAGTFGLTALSDAAAAAEARLEAFRGAAQKFDETSLVDIRRLLEALRAAAAE